MIDFVPRGAIFDLDDTLLSNQPTGNPIDGLHAISRLKAVHEAGKRHGIKALRDYDAAANVQAFLTSPVHTIQGAVWNILQETGVVDIGPLNLEHPLLQEISARKIALQLETIRERGEEVAGASDFVRHIGQVASGRLSIASMATAAEIDEFLKKYALTDLFDGRIASYETTTHPKPHPESFENAFQLLQLPDSDRRHVLAFEDDPRGITSAKAAGLYVCAITTRFDRDTLQSLEVAPDLVCDSYEEFGQAIFG